MEDDTDSQTKRPQSREKISIPWRLYVVEVDPARTYGALHTVSSRHLLTESPAAGDKIAAVLHGQKILEIGTYGKGSYDCVGAHLRGGDDRGFRITRHPGRSALLGEDTLDGAFGGDALDELVPELLTGRHDWVYAAVEVEFESDDEPWDPRDVIQAHQWEKHADVFRRVRGEGIRT